MDNDLKVENDDDGGFEEWREKAIKEFGLKRELSLTFQRREGYKGTNEVFEIPPEEAKCPSEVDVAKYARMINPETHDPNEYDFLVMPTTDQIVWAYTQDKARDKAK